MEERTLLLVVEAHASCEQEEEVIRLTPLSVHLRAHKHTG